MSNPNPTPEHGSVKDEAAIALLQAKEVAIDKGREMFHEAEKVVRTTLNDLNKEIQNLPVWKDTEKSIQQHPMQSMLIMFGLGVIVGVGMRR